jgi:hypothetical protein
MEELRAYVADRLAFSLINRRQVAPEGFRRLDNGAVAMDDATRKTVLTAYQQRKRETVTHPFLGESTTVGMLPCVGSAAMGQTGLLVKLEDGNKDCEWIYRSRANPGRPRGGIVPSAPVLAPGSALGSRPRVALSSVQALSM